MPIRVVLAEDDVLLRKGLAQLIDAEPGLEVAGRRRTFRRLSSRSTRCVPTSS